MTELSRPIIVCAAIKGPESRIIASARHYDKGMHKIVAEYRKANICSTRLLEPELLVLPAWKWGGNVF